MPDPTAAPSLTGQPPMGASPVGVASGNPGQSANALATIREALKLLEQALPQLPAGSDPYKAVYDAIGKVSKHVGPSNEVPGVQKTQLSNLKRDADQSAMMQSVMRSMGGSMGAEGGGGAATSVPGGGAAAA